MTARCIICLALVLLLGACSGPGYYLQAISGQLSLMSDRRQVDVLLKDPGTDIELAAQLRGANQIIDYAETALGMPANGSYSSYAEVDGDAVVWNVIATTEFSLTAREWCFPVAGCVPYRGYFKQQKALESAAKMRRKGMDVLVSPATAYSSLGWFRDPLVSTMFSGSDTRLAAYLFHELAHQRLYVKDDGVFNESYASFVEERGIRSWLETNLQHQELRRWRRLKIVKTDFAALVDRVRSELQVLYGSDTQEDTMREGKTEILTGFRYALEKLKSDRWQGRDYFSEWLEKPVNNARLALYNTYEGSQCAFANLLDQAGGNFKEFHRLAEQQSRLKKADREKWLSQSCTPIAPTDDL